MPKAPPLFRPSYAPTRQEQNREHDQRRGSARKRGYSGRWDKARLTHLERHPLCLGCEAVGIIEPATVVDHVEPHQGDQMKFWNTRMWQSCCAWHHSQIKQKLEVMFERGQIGVEALWLSSPAAVALTRSTPR